MHPLKALFLIWSVLVMAFSCKPAEEASLSEVLGRSYRASLLERPHRLFDSRVDQKKLERFIRASLTFKALEGKKKEKSSAKKYLRGSHIRATAKFIIMVSEVLKIDAFVLTGLVARESWFMPNACYSGGCGMAQLTADGIREVNDHYTKRPDHYSGPAHRYIKASIKTINRRFGANVFVKVPLVDEKSLNLSHYESIKDNKLTNLVYGGLYLKLMLAHQARKNPGVTMQELYRLGLQA